MKSGRKSLDEYKSEWERAKDFLIAAKNNFKLEDYKTAANRIYFACERAVVAALKYKDENVSRNHKDVWMYSKLLDLNVDAYGFLRKLYDMRLQADYGSSGSIIELNKDNLAKYLLKAEDLLNDIKSKYDFE